MPQQYVASDSRTGLQVQVTGEFPGEPDDRVRIARTTNLFTRLMSTILSTEAEADRRERFRAIETQLEVADALIRGDMREVERLVRETLRQMGVTDEQLREAQEQMREQLRQMGVDPSALQSLGLFGAAEEDDDDSAPPDADAPPDDVPPDDRPPPRP